jgi:hypothetical protein
MLSVAATEKVVRIWMQTMLAKWRTLFATVPLNGTHYSHSYGKSNCCYVMLFAIGSAVPARMNPILFVLLWEMMFTIASQPPILLMSRQPRIAYA